GISSKFESRMFWRALALAGAFRLWLTGSLSYGDSSGAARRRMSPLDMERPVRQVTPATVLGVCLFLGLVLGGWVLGSQIKAIRLADRYVTVKGLVERTVKSDSAVWPVTFKEAGNELPAVFAKSEADKAAVLKFFAEQGITLAEITVGQIQVTDKLANEYGGNNQASPRYV